MEMLQLRYFYESAQNGSFAKTAEKYMVPTTSVSAAVKRLEKELGCRLFDRTCNRILLNEDGMRLLRSLHTVFAELDGAVTQLSTRDAWERQIRILVRGMRRKITELIIAYSALYPQVRFHTVFDFREEDLDSYDIIIDEDSDAYPRYEKFVLSSRRLQVICSAGDPMCGRKLTMRELAGRKFVSMGERGNLHRILLRVCDRAGFTPEFSVLCNDIECYDKFVASGMGIAIGTEDSSRHASGSGIARLDVTDFNERYTVCGYYNQACCTGRIRDFLDFVKSRA